MDWRLLINALIKRNGWEAVEDALCELAKNVPPEQLDGVIELVNAAYSLDDTNTGQLVRVFGNPPAVH